MNLRRKDRNCQQAEKAFTLEPKGKGEGDAFRLYAHAIKNLLGLEQEPNLANTFCVERVNLISPPQGKAIRKKSRWRHEEETSEQANASL